MTGKDWRKIHEAVTLYVCFGVAAVAVLCCLSIGIYFAYFDRGGQDARSHAATAQALPLRGPLVPGTPGDAAGARPAR